MSVFADRGDRLAALVAERELDLLLVSNLVNVRYLTGFGGTNGLCLIGTRERYLTTDFRYVERAKAEASDYELHRGKRELLGAVEELTTALAGSDGQIRLGFDDAHLTVRQHAKLAELLDAHAELVPAGGLVERLRAIKDEAEVAAIRRAAALADELYRWLVEEHGLAGHTEAAVARALELRGRELGADELSFPPIVAAAERGALPHAEPREVEIERGTLVIVDLGCKLGGYCSDCTRTFATGALDSEASAVYELVRFAQRAALDRLSAGASCEHVDAGAREPIDEAGHGEHFGHGTGHGVGLEVHEEPRLAPGVSEPLAAGNVVTIEPGVYLPGRFGVRIEDLTLVTDDGYEILTSAPKELIAVR